MVKLKRSLLGTEAHGILAKNLLLRTRHRQIIASQLTIPSNPRTPAQIAHRTLFQNGITQWHTLTPEQKAVYAAIDPRIGYNPAYLNFMREWLLQMVAAHHETHEDGGTDEISLASLSGLLADQQVAFRLRTGLDADKPGADNTEGDVWWGTDTDKLYVWDGTAWSEVGAAAPGATVAFPGTKVWDAIAPTSWTDIDLSGIIGANAALILIRVKVATSATICRYTIRENGQTYGLPWGSGANGADLNTSYIGYLICKASASGIIEFISNNTKTVELYLEAYAKA